ncbi:unnamed protein product [Parajaminaea phylloscopi]
MERVQYHLERLLPSLQLLSALGLFSSTELQALTQQRRQYETQLITRGVTFSQYLDYVKLEENFERLTSLRVARAGKDAEGNEVVTLRDRNRIKRFQERHILSIWQRSVAKLGPADATVFVIYLQWLQGRKMRRVYSEIAAQALSLHSSNTSLWIQVADWELNSNLDASAARLTLLRAIRLNTFVQSDTKRKAAARSHERKRRKRARQLAREGNGDGDDDDDGAEGSGSSSDEGDGRDSSGQIEPVTHESGESIFHLPERLAPSSLRLLNLWLNYFRMECVFLERLRRRWAVLGINGNSSAQNGGATDADAASGAIENEDEDEDEASSSDEGGEGQDEESAMPAGDGSALRKIQDGQDQGEAAANATAQKAAPNQILSGALPLAIATSALDLDESRRDAGVANSKTTASPALPAELRFLFLTCVLRFLSEFPFSSASANEGEELRASLTRSILQALSGRESTTSEMMSLVRHAARDIAASRCEAERLLDKEDEEGCPQEELEQRHNVQLRAAAALHYSRDEEERLARLLATGTSLQLDCDQGREDDDADTPTAPASIFAAFERELERGQDRRGSALRRAQNLTLSRIAEDIRESRVLAGECGSQKTAAAIKVKVAHAVRELLQGVRSEAATTASLRMDLAVWHSLAYQRVSSEEGPDVWKAVNDPLLPFVSGVLTQEYRVVSGGPAGTQARCLYLFFQYQAALHASSLQSDSTQATWNQLDAEAERLVGSSRTSKDAFEPLLVYVRCCIWVIHWQKQRAQEESTHDVDVLSVVAEGQRFWTSLLGLEDEKKGSRPSRSSSKDLQRQWRSLQLLLHWVVTEAEEGRGIYSDLTRSVVVATRRALLLTTEGVDDSTTTAVEVRQRVQSLHDEALVTLWNLARGLDDENDDGGDVPRRAATGADAVAPAGVIALWRDSKRALPSLAAWVRLANRDEAQSHPAIFEHLEQIALAPSLSSSSSSSSSTATESELCDAFAALFAHRLRKGDVRNGLALLQKARRRGDESWQRLIEGVWQEAVTASSSSSSAGTGV